jgi:hypothetical protein
MYEAFSPFRTLAGMASAMSVSPRSMAPICAARAAANSSPAAGMTLALNARRPFLRVSLSAVTNSGPSVPV